MNLRRLTLVILLTLTTSLHAASPIMLAVTPKYGFAPLSGRAKIVIEPNADNRMACFTVDGTEFRQHCWEHVGLSAPKTTWEEKTLQDLPAGIYTITATITLLNGKQYSTSSTICSIGGDVQCSPDL